MGEKKGTWQIDSGKEWKSGTHKQGKSNERGKTGAEDADKLGREEVLSRINGAQNKIKSARIGKQRENRKEETDPGMKERK